MNRLLCAWKENPVLVLVCMGLWMLPVTNAVGQVPLYLASVWWLISAFRSKEPVVWRTQGFLIGFMILILISLTYAVHPENGVGKLNRFLIFPLAGAVTACCLRAERPSDAVMRICISLLGGVCMRGLMDLVKFPVEVYVYDVKFVNVGNMTSPQFYLAGLMTALGLRFYKKGTLGVWFWFALPLVITGLYLHQKRGIWFASLAVVGLWAVGLRYWKAFGILILIACMSLFVPKVQERLEHLREVMKENHGGRRTLWEQVAPRIIQDHPFGMGYNGTNYEDFREALPEEYHLEVGLRHLHNNHLQILAELGWHGVLFWTVWMASMLWTGFRKLPLEDVGLRYTVAFVLLGLLFNGMVEYNFGDSEILKLYLVLFGLLDVFSRVKRAETSDHPADT